MERSGSWKKTIIFKDRAPIVPLKSTHDHGVFSDRDYKVVRISKRNEIPEFFSQISRLIMESRS